MSGDPRVPQVAKILRKQYPVLRKRLPLAIGVRDEIVSKHPTITEIADYLMRYLTGDRQYLENVAKGGHRFHLNGKLAGPIKPGHSLNAQQRLDRARRIQ